MTTESHHMIDQSRARWQQSSPTSWLLKLPVKDGGEVLASLNKYEYGYIWTTDDDADWHESKYGAQLAVRRALRNAEHER